MYNGHAVFLWRCGIIMAMWYYYGQVVLHIKATW
jgi:hypothetical protein